jgi:hypothetical protein
MAGKVDVRRLWPALSVLLLVASASSTLAASSWRCGSRLVGAGDAIEDVLARCGEPTARELSTEIVTRRVSCDLAVTRVVAIEQWTYNRGSKQFVRLLTFRDGTLVDIDEGSYGY